MKAMTRKQKTLEVLYDDGKPIGSKWTILSLDQLNFSYRPDKRAKGLNLN